MKRRAMNWMSGAALLVLAGIVVPRASAAADNLTRIGVPPDGVTVTGPGLAPDMGRGEVAMVISGIVGGAPCYLKDGGVIVVDVDPVRLAERQLEFTLCASGRMDPSTCYPDRRVPPDHFVKGALTSDGKHLTIDLRYEDKKGSVIYRESASGRLDDMFAVHDEVIAKLNWDLCPPIKVYNGTFSTHDVAVNSEYTSDMAGDMRWDLDESEEEVGQRWHEYTGSGHADYTIQRKGCGDPATFSRLPVTGRMKVYDDERYEFDVSVEDDNEQSRDCARPDLDNNLKWQETYSAVEASASSSDHCAVKEFFPLYPKIADLSYSREGSCSQVNPVNEYRDKWSFKGEGAND